MIILLQESRELRLPNPALQDEYQLSAPTVKKSTRGGSIYTYRVKVRKQLELEISIPREVITVPPSVPLWPRQNDVISWFSSMTHEPIALTDWLDREWVGYITNTPIELVYSKTSTQFHLSFTGIHA